MKALILAAGFGSRLMPLTENCPKALIPVNGKPILVQQIESLLQNGVTDITIVSGYKADVLQKSVHDLFPTVHILECREYATTNNMYSAFFARENIGDHDFLMMNADVFFDASVIAALLAFPYPNAIVTDIGTYYEESMKVVEKNGFLTDISKQIKPEDALGASIDVYRFSAKAGKAFFEKCEEYIVRDNIRNKWSEVALQGILADEPFKACPLNGRWMEIDNLDDLTVAERLFNN